MSTKTLQRGNAMNFALVHSWDAELGSITKFERSKKTGALLVTDMPVFRSGTFRDSWGEQSTWESMHMQQMVSHYELLKNNGALADIPVRAGHYTGLSGLIGHHSSLRVAKLKNAVDGKEYDYLLATYEVTEPDAQGKIERGTWRNRSSEIGTYTTNDEASFWPVYMGFAYVDIPAVEGLNGFSKQNQTPDGSGPIILTEKEEPVTTPTEPTTPPTPAPAPTPPAPAPAPTPAPAPHAAAPVFNLFGKQVNDPAAVQAHIGVLEAFHQQARENARNEFVTGLAKDNKILASDLEAAKAFAKDLTDEQFESYKKTFANAQAVPGIGQVAGALAPHQGAPNQVLAAADALEGDAELVKMHRAAGTKQEVLEKTPAYQRLVAAGRPTV